jgi:hypothetical protein
MFNLYNAACAFLLSQSHPTSPLTKGQVFAFWMLDCCVVVELRRAAVKSLPDTIRARLNVNLCRIGRAACIALNYCIALHFTVSYTYAIPNKSWSVIPPSLAVPHG